MKILLIALIMTLGSSFAGLSDAYAKNYYSLGTASTAGTWYILGAGFSAHINKHYPKVKMTAEVTAGSAENYNLLKRKKMDLCFTTPLVISDDLKSKQYGGGAKENVRMVMWSYQSADFHFIVRKESPIKDLCDIKGKKVGIGPHGSKAMDVTKEIIESVCGYKADKDYDALYYTFGESLTGIKDNMIGMGNAMGGYPVASILDLSISKPIRIISLTTDQFEKLWTVRPTLKKVTIPAGTYKGVDYDVTTPGATTGILSTPEVPEEDIYGIVKAMFTNVEERNAFHPQAKKYTIEATVEIAKPLVKLGIKFHPGTVKYLKEIGAWSSDLEAK